MTKFNPQPKTFTPNKEKKGLNRNRKSTGEKEVFMEIWNERPHICEHCNAPLQNPPLASYFSHNKPKSTHPELRLEKTNINLHCEDCHYVRDNGTEKEYNKRKNLKAKIV